MKAGWKRAVLGDVCEIVNGGTPKTGVTAYWGGEHAWITPAEMGKLDSPYVEATERTLTEGGLANSSARLLPSSSVVLSSRAPIGHLVINTVPMATNQGCKGLIPSKQVDPKFLYYYLFSIVPLLNELGTGATFKELSGSKLREVPIEVPPLPEQRRIVGILDEAFEGIATAKANAERNLQSAGEVFDAVRASAFARRDDGWHEVTLDRLAENLDSKRVPITKSARREGQYPYYGASGIVDYVADFILEEETLLVSEDGANLISRTTPIAFSATGKYWVNNHAHILRFKSKVTQRFVEMYIESIKIDEFVTGAAQPKLTQKALYSIPIPIPASEAGQRRVVSEVEAVQTASERMSALYERKLANLDELKKSLLDRAFRGEL